MTRRLSFLPFLALLSVAAIFAACGDDDDNKTSTPTAVASTTPSPDANAAATEQFMRDLVDSYNAGDLQAFVDSFDDNGIREFNGDDPVRPAEESRTEVLGNSGGDKVTVRSFSDITTTGDVTTLTFDSANGSILNHEIFKLKKTGDTFLIAGYESGSPDIPAGVTALTVEATEYKYILDTTKIAAGQQAFAFSNIGSQFHELRILKVDATTPVQQIVDDALAVEDPSQLPADIEADVGSGYSAPGQTSNVVFVDPLAAGRYVLLCFIPDETDDQPHAAHGMFKEITIP